MRPRLLAWLGRAVGLVMGGYLGWVALRGSRMLVRPEVRPLLPDVDGEAATPADLGLEYEEARFTTSDRVTCSGWLIPAGRETRAAVLLLHGFTGHRLPELVAVVPWLQPRYHVLQFDFRGHGASDRSMVTLGALERRDVAAAVDFLRERGYGPIALMGISMGAATAIVAAPDLPVRAVVADAAFAELHHPIRNRMREVGYPLSGLGARAIVAAAAVRARMSLPSPLRAVARIAPRALLLIAPRDDRLIEWTQSRRLFEAAREPKELYVVEGAGHGESHAVGGAAYEQRVLDFLARYLDVDPASQQGAAEAAPSVREPSGQRL